MVNPVVVAAFNRHGKVLKTFSQKKQKDVKKHIRRSVIVDMDVEGKSYCNLQKFNTRNATMMEGLVWASLLTLLVKRRIGMSDQQLAGIELSTFMVAKNTQGWFYQLMESITQGVISTLKKTWQKTINFLSKYAQRANPKRDKEKGRLKCGLNPIVT